MTNGTDSVFYDWDFDNRLTAADMDGNGVNEVANEYDGDGIRTAQLLDVDQDGTRDDITRHLIDANRSYSQVLEEYTPGGIIKVSYVHGLDLISQNRIIDGIGKSFYHNDGLGSTRALTDLNGDVVNRYTYDAFGRTIMQSGVTGNVYLFAGEARDSSTGLDYLRARYLDSESGRFASRDPFEGVLRRPVSLHDYLYANVNPVTFVDPTGYLSLPEINTVIGVIGNLATRVSPILTAYNTARSFVDVLTVIDAAISLAASGNFSALALSASTAAFAASKAAFQHFNPTEAVDSALQNFRWIFSRSFAIWSPWLAAGNAFKIEGLVVYLPSPPTDAIHAAIPAGKYRGFKLTAIAGGAKHTSRVFGIGIDMKGSKGIKQYQQIWRMDYHPIHIVPGTSRFDLGNSSAAVKKDGDFHHHICKPDRC